jgi:hypothetical protein
MPANTTAATALDIGAFPFSLTQNTDGEASLYYTFTLPALGPFGFRITGTGSRDFLFKLYTNVGETEQYLTPVSGNGQIEGADEPFQVPVLAGYAGATLWVRVFFISPAVTALTLESYVLPVVTIPNYVVVVPDDTHSFPATVLDPDTGVVLNYISAVPASEAGASLPNGYSLSYARSEINTPTGDATAVVLVQGTTLITETTGVVTTGLRPLITGSPTGNSFWLTYANALNTEITIKQIDLTGAVVRTIGPLAFPTAVSRLGFAVTPDETRGYVSLAGSNPIKQIDLVNEVVLVDFTPATADYFRRRDLLMLPDGGVLAPYQTAVPQVVRRYDAAGVPVQEYTITAGSDPTLNRMADAHDNGASFWVWLFSEDADSNLTGTFQRIRISDGAVLASFISYEFNTGKGPSHPPAVNTVLTGHSNSCPFWVLIGGGAPEPPPGPDGDGDGDYLPAILNHPEPHRGSGVRWIRV